MERETGFEPATSTLARSHSTTELFPPARPRWPRLQLRPHWASDASRLAALLRAIVLSDVFDLCTLPARRLAALDASSRLRTAPPEKYRTTRFRPHQDRPILHSHTGQGPFERQQLNPQRRREYGTNILNGQVAPYRHQKAFTSASTAARSPICRIPPTTSKRHDSSGPGRPSK